MDGREDLPDSAPERCSRHRERASAIETTQGSLRSPMNQTESSVESANVPGLRAKSRGREDVFRCGARSVVVVGWATPTVPGAEARVGGRSPPYDGSLGTAQSIKVDPPKICSRSNKIGPNLTDRRQRGNASRNRSGRPRRLAGSSRMGRGTTRSKKASNPQHVLSKWRATLMIERVAWFHEGCFWSAAVSPGGASDANNGLDPFHVDRPPLLSKEL